MNPDHIWTMSFQSKQYKLLHWFIQVLFANYIKTAVVLKRHQFEDSKSEKIELKVLKCQHVGVYDNSAMQCENGYKNESKGKNIGYIPFQFIAPSLPFQKKSNRPTDYGEEIKSLNHLVCILKID